MNVFATSSTNPEICQHPGSFRDPAGFLYKFDGILYRQINSAGELDYDHAKESNLYTELFKTGLLIPHEEVSNDLQYDSNAYKIIRPELIPFISYPYEWCFSQLKEAALTTLRVQKKALEHKMTLKDASAFNVQFLGSTPIFIDALSFERYIPGKPWSAYLQFCQHFLMPLALMSYRGPELLRFFQNNIDGIPLEVGTKLLPLKSRFRFGLLTHLFLHRYFKGKTSVEGKHLKGSSSNSSIGSFSLNSFYGLIDSLKSTVNSLDLKIQRSTWNNYYSETNYTPEAMLTKETLVKEMANKIKPKTVWDIGGNNGRFSNLLAANTNLCVCFDSDPWCVELNYRNLSKNSSKNVLPLFLDATNPTPAIGWNSNERSSFFERGPADLTLALAVIHHLRITGGAPFSTIVQFFSRFSKNLLIEFVPKEDSQVVRLLSSRTDIYSDYNESEFLSAFKEKFKVLERKEIPQTKRVLFLMTAL